MSLRTAMMDEIMEQGELLQEIFENRKEITKKFVKLCKEQQFKKIYFVGNGSPYYAGYTLSFAAEKLMGADAVAIPAGVFHNHCVFNRAKQYANDEILLVCPAESGRSKGQVDAAHRAKEVGIKVMSTTLNPNGILAGYSDIVLTKPGQHEQAMAATKGQTMGILLIFLNFLEAAYQTGKITEETYQMYLEGCKHLSVNVKKSIQDTCNWFWENKSRVMGAGKYFLIGYGANYGTVQEAGLKFLECHGKPTYALELEESLHGLFRALHKDDMVFFVAAEKGNERNRMEALAEAIEPYCKHRIIIQSTKELAQADSLRIHSSDLELINTMEYLIPFQVLSFLIADEMGIDLSIPLVASLDDAMSPAYEDENENREKL